MGGDKPKCHRCGCIETRCGNISGLWEIGGELWCWSCLSEEFTRLWNIAQVLPRTRDNAIVMDGTSVYFPAANGVLELIAYLGPRQANDFPSGPYPWREGFASYDAAKAARGTE